MSELIIMIGLSASGKSTVAKNLAENTNTFVVSTDKIREELSFYEDQSKNDKVFKIFHNRIKDGLLKGYTMVADATNITMKSRRPLIEIGKMTRSKITAVVVAKRFYDCLIDNNFREHPVPEDVIRNQITKFQIPFYNEGFDDIVINKVHTEYPSFIIANNMFDFDQKTKYHTDNLSEHSEKVFMKFNKKYSNLDLGAIYHDCGKPYCQTFDKYGQAHYYGHANIGAYILMTYFKNASLDDLFLVNYHMLPFDWNNQLTKNKYIKILGREKYNMLLYFNECDKIR